MDAAVLNLPPWLACGALRSPPPPLQPFQPRNQVRRLNMYNTRAVRDKKGRIIHEVSAQRRRPAACEPSSALQPPQLPAAAAAAARLPSAGAAAAAACPFLSTPRPPHPPHPQDLQSKELPTTRIQPDRRWFGNTRVIGQQQLQAFRDQMSAKVSDSYTVLLREKKLPLQLLEDPERKVGAKQARVDLLSTQPFADTFGPGKRRKRPKLAAEGLEELVAGAAQKEAR